MRMVRAGLAITLDGVVESPSGDWLTWTDEMSAIIDAGLADSDAILLGRRTYLQFAELWPPLGDATAMSRFMNRSPKYVLSSTLERLEWPGSTLLTGELADEVGRLKAMPGGIIQVPGSPRLVRSLLQSGLLDELSLMIHPVVLGHGSHLFAATEQPVSLQLVSGQTLSNGVLAVTYRRIDDSGRAR
jgi:dihydrofolate reductase